jgi:hypothetical protein
MGTPCRCEEVQCPYHAATHLPVPTRPESTSWRNGKFCRKAEERFQGFSHDPEDDGAFAVLIEAIRKKNMTETDTLRVFSDKEVLVQLAEQVGVTSRLAITAFAGFIVELQDQRDSVG